MPESLPKNRQDINTQGVHSLPHPSDNVVYHPVIYISSKISKIIRHTHIRDIYINNIYSQSNCANHLKDNIDT